LHCATNQHCATTSRQAISFHHNALSFHHNALPENHDGNLPIPEDTKECVVISFVNIK
jgi:hypothetical protein